MFLPFRSREDLIDTCDGTHWARFNTAKNKNELFPKGLDILQHIQDRHNCSKIKKGGDWLEDNTIPVDVDNEVNSSVQLEEDQDDMIPQDILLLSSNRLVDGCQDQGIFESIIKGHKSGDVDI